MKKAIHVKEYTRKKHGRAKFGGKVSAHDKSGSHIEYLGKPCWNCGEVITKKNYRGHYPICSTAVCRLSKGGKQIRGGRYIRGVPKNPELLNQLRAMIGSGVIVKGDYPVQYTLKDVGVSEGGLVEAIIEDQYGTDVVDGKLIMRAKSGRAEMKSELQTLAHQINAKELAFAKFNLSYDNDRNTIGLVKGQKAMRIKYNRGSDLYDITTMKFKGVGTVTEEKEHTGIYADMLKPLIQDFFKFEYVMHHFGRAKSLIDGYGLDNPQHHKEFMKKLTKQSKEEPIKWVSKDKKYMVFNATDGFFASPEVFTLSEAKKFIKEFPSRYAHQGYYLTSNRDRIDPRKVVLRLEEV